MRHITKLVLLLCLLVSSIYTPALGAQEPQPLLVYTTGLFDSADGSVLYSVLLAAQSDEALTDLTISSPLPEGATFVDVFWTPEVASFMDEQDGMVIWTVPELAADTIMGPFTYRVTFADAATQAPVNVAATVSSENQTFEATVEEGILQPLAPKGSLTVSTDGTDGLVPVEDTGVLVDIPAGTFDQDITLTFERQPFDDSLSLPKLEDLWWCTLYSITAEPAVAIENPIAILLPVRRTSTPGLAVQFFYQTSDGQWLGLENTSTEAALIAGGGSHAAAVGFTFDQVLDDQVIAAGYVEQDNLRGAIDFSSSNFFPQASDIITTSIRGR